MNGRSMSHVVRIVVLLCVVVASGAWDGHAKRSEPRSCATVPIAKPSGLCHGPVVLGPAIPADMSRNAGALDSESGSRMVDCFAWESFAALNWPAREECRGAPARGRGAASDWTSERVWETYKEPYELFQATDETWDPADLTFDDAAPTGACGGLEAGKKILRHGSKFPIGSQLVSEDTQAFLSIAILTDQQGNAVWYEILMNRDVFDYIRDAGMARTGAYSFGGPLTALDEVDFPTARDGASGAGTIEIKAAWRQMTDDDDTSRYFTREAVTYDGTDCEEITVGLVGLHIARKVASSPRWIWATFEHEDNVPDAGTDGDGRDYNFFSAQCAADPPTDCSQQVAIVDTDDLCCPNLITFPGSENQVTRLIPIQATQQLNQRFREAYAAAGSPFQYFLLVGASGRSQRPGGGKMLSAHRLAAIEVPSTRRSGGIDTPGRQDGTSGARHGSGRAARTGPGQCWRPSPARRATSRSPSSYATPRWRPCSSRPMRRGPRSLLTAA